MEKNIKKELIADSLFTIACLIIYNFFPATDLFQRIFATVIFLVVTPLVYKKFVLKEKVSEMGFCLGDWKKGVSWLIIALSISLAIFFALFKGTDYLASYKLPTAVVDNFWNFIAYELLAVTFFVAIYEIFFRGFVLFNFSKKIGRYAVLLQFLLFVGLVAIQGFKAEFIPYVIFAFFGGIIAYKSDSILYSFIGQTLFIFLVDMSIIKMLY